MDENRFVVDYQITGRCNMTCNFCAGAQRSSNDSSLEEITKGIEKLSLIGVDTIVLTGGEPLLRNDVSQIIKNIKSFGIKIYLSTNAILLFDYYDNIGKNLSCLGMPLDGSSEKMSAKMTRNYEQYRATINALKYFLCNPPAHKVKVGTIVSKLNSNDLLRIGELLFDNPNVRPPDTWRLYQFTPLGRGRYSQKLHEIDDDTFVEISRDLYKKFPNVDIKPLSNKDSDSSYIFITPTQEIRILINNEYKKVGNLNQDSVDKLNSLKEKYGEIIKRGFSNRGWLNDSQ